MKGGQTSLSNAILYVQNLLRLNFISLRSLPIAIFHWQSKLATQINFQFADYLDPQILPNSFLLICCNL